VAGRQTNLRHFAHRRVWLLGRARHDLNAHAATKRRIVQGGRLGLVFDFGAAKANELVDCRHFVLKSNAEYIKQNSGCNNFFNEFWQCRPPMSAVNPAE